MLLTENLEDQRNIAKTPYTLCSSCSAFTLSLEFAADSTIREFDHYANACNIWSGARADCHICSLINATGKVPVELAQARVIARVVSTASYQRTHLITWLALGADTYRQQVAQGIVQHSRTDEKDEPTISSAWTVSNASDLAIKTIKSWIQPNKLEEKRLAIETWREEQKKKHWRNRLRRNKDLNRKSPPEIAKHVEFLANRPRNLPTRLVDVSDVEQRDFIKLVPGDFALSQDYVSLSYTWGGLEPVLLTSDNITQWEKGINIRTLPRTFQDAVWLVQQIGVRFLWIDALCIRQKVEAEWAKESRRMGQIFANSLLTLAASDARDCTVGILQIRNPLAQNSCLFSVGTDEWQYELKMSCYPAEGVISHLDSRGWVYQERLLSPCTLHFFHAKLLLETEDNTYCELHPSSGCGPLRKDMKARFSRILNYNSGGSLAEDWAQLIADYSSTLLTRCEDRLAAIAGLLESVKKADGPYSFGLWTNLMPLQLLWRTASPATKYHDCVPSWSWASLCDAGRITGFGLFYMNRNDHVTMWQYPKSSDTLGLPLGFLPDENHSVGIRAYTIPSRFAAPDTGHTGHTAISATTACTLSSAHLEFMTDPDQKVHFFPDTTLANSELITRLADPNDTIKDSKSQDQDADVLCVLFCDGTRTPDRMFVVECLVLKPLRNKRLPVPGGHKTSTLSMTEVIVCSRIGSAAIYQLTFPHTVLDSFFRGNLQYILIL